MAAADAPPAGVSGEEWASIQEQIEAEQLKVTESDRPGSLSRADSSSQRLTAHLDDEDLVIVPHGRGEPAWEFGMRLTAWGAAYILNRDQGGTGAWGQVATITAVDGAEYSYFEHSVAIHRDTAMTLCCSVRLCASVVQSRAFRIGIGIDGDPAHPRFIEPMNAPPIRVARFRPSGDPSTRSRTHSLRVT